MNASALFKTLYDDITSIFHGAAPPVFFDGTGVFRAVTVPPSQQAAHATFTAVYDGLPVRFVPRLDNDAILMLRWCGALYLRECAGGTDRRVIAADTSGERIAIVTVDDEQVDAVDRLLGDLAVAV